MIHFCCVSSHASDQWMCQWVFPAQMSSCSERHKYCGIWTLHHLLEEVTALNIHSLSACILHASNDFPFLMLMSYKPFYIKNVKVYTFITCLNKYSLTNYKSTQFLITCIIFFFYPESQHSLRHQWWERSLFYHMWWLRIFHFMSTQVSLFLY